MKKISKNFILLGSATMLIAPVVTVVSCGSGSSDGLDDLEVLSPALSKLEAGLDEVVKDLLISPSSNDNGVNTITMPKLEESEKGTVTEVTSLSKVFTLFTQDELDALTTPVPAGSENLITEEQLTEALTELNKQINTEINSRLQTEIAQGNNIHHDLTLMRFENTFRYSYTFNKDARTLEFHVYHFEEHETDLTKFADRFMADPVVGIKALTKEQMENLYGGESFEFFNGGGVLGWEWMNEQYHLNGNYLENDAKPSTPSTIDPTHYKSDFDTFLTNFNGENVIPTRWLTTAGDTVNRKPSRDYQRFGISPTAPKDIIITTKSKPDLMNQKLYIEFTFHKNGEIDDSSSEYRTWIKDVPGQTESVIRLIELPDAIPNGVDTPNYNADKARFNSSLAQITKLLSISQVTDLISGFLLENQSELKPFVDAIADSVEFINNGHDETVQGLNGNTRVQNRNYVALLGGVPDNDFAKEFQEDLYNTICADPRVSMSHLLEVGSIVGQWLANGVAQLPASIAGMTTSQQAALLSIGYALYFEHDFIVNWTPTPAATPAP